ncbi:GMP synthase [glutamine-hydrolyzing] [Poriferisphaera corsica]|uniref:GMP synthase [glutamine-hydrolyzing] n=1 Tax=Poriferisphaera corsica TaxID=2528020 RepID=A0A517YQ35_9BACT|nr:type 1 glutamine amidotransferase [Poriferisphaera corsica]QDU32339.1 GMP synthase [glutamine-hydrolyzing] [Poriferisphaera corsica]
MAVLILQHHEDEVPGRLGEVLAQNSHEINVVKLCAGEDLPSDYGDIDGLVVLGGPMNIDEIEEHPYLECEMALIKWMHQQELPVLGVCLGAQLIAKALGGEVGQMSEVEIGMGDVELNHIGRMDAMLYGMPWRTSQFHMHGYEVTQLPKGATLLASSKSCKNQLFCVGMRTWGVQYHFEWDKQTMLNIVERFSAWIQDSQIDVGTIRSGIEVSYDLHRHFSDRLCDRLVLLVFNATTRSNRAAWSPANF